MCELVRMTLWRTYHNDGKTNATYQAEKGMCAVGILLGEEPLRIAKSEDEFDIEAWILKAAENIKKQRGKSPSRKAPAKKGATKKKKPRKT